VQPQPEPKPFIPIPIPLAPPSDSGTRRRNDDDIPYVPNPDEEAKRKSAGVRTKFLSPRGFRSENVSFGAQLASILSEARPPGGGAGGAAAGAGAGMTRQQILDKLGGAGTVLYPVLAALAIGGGSLLGQAGGGGGGDVASQVMSTGGLLAGQVGLQKLTGKGLYNPKVDPVEAGMDALRRH
tara:strand:- start:199 stop:744 length:546 start_codon:yes stop_codon:yes gene_type:complete